MRRQVPSTLLVLLALAACGGSNKPDDLKPGATDFTSEEPANAGGRNRTGAPTAGESADDGAAEPQAPGAPGGRNAAVEEADVYKLAAGKLYYLNTYRGFVVYDVADAKNPKRLGRLPVYGYPIEMFVEGNTVFALLRDALYLTRKGDAFKFERRNVSQLVAIDVSDPAAPKLLKTLDIVGELREGVSRKIENSIYVVSYQPQSYHWGWRAPGEQQTPPKEQAWVYSFDVSKPQEPTLVDKLQIFEGGSVQINDDKNGFSYNRYFEGVAFSATSNALMVVENWGLSLWQSGTSRQGCGTYESNQRAVVSIIDVSDPKGTIRRHARFETDGRLGDQFKQTYVFDPTTKTGTYYGIFARQVWSSAGCGGNFWTQNTLESWDVTNGAAPARLDRLDFGKPEETVRGSAFDVERNVVYAITARNIDPLYAISIADPRDLKILSAVDGLSGDMTVFRLIGDRKFLVAIGRDTSETCQGFEDPGTNTFRRTNVAVSLIDVRDLAKVRLVQRRCVAIENAEWVGSETTWNLDQAHKMIGMHSDGTANVITVPVYYWKKSNAPGDPDWWYRYETAVGIMSWDLAAYVDTLPPAQQSVLKNHGTFVHPEGQVSRSVVYTEPGPTPQRMMLNLSDTHISIANLTDLAKPQLESTVELAPFHAAVYRFGGHVVEEMRVGGSLYGGPDRGRSLFRVKAAGGALEDAPALATFSATQVQSVIKQGNGLVLFRSITHPKEVGGQYVPPTFEAQVWDLTDPLRPRKAGRVAMPADAMPYYGYFCGDWYWGAYFFSGGSNMAVTSDAIALLNHTWNNARVTTRILVLDVANPDSPQLVTKEIDVRSSNEWDTSYGLLPDGGDPRAFWLSFRKRVGETQTPGGLVVRYKDYAQRWARVGGKADFAGGAAINLPGPLTKTWSSTQGPRFLTRSDSWTWVEKTATEPARYISKSNLALLRPIDLDGRPGAELLDAVTFEDAWPDSLVLEGDKLFLTARTTPWWGYYRGGGAIAEGDAVGVPRAQTVEKDMSDRLVAFDLAGSKLAKVYDAPTSMWNTSLVGLHAGKLVLNLQGDGFLIADVSNPAAPKGLSFLRTLGWATHIDLSGGDLYAAAGHFGTYHMKLDAASAIPLD